MYFKQTNEESHTNFLFLHEFVIKQKRKKEKVSWKIYLDIFGILFHLEELKISHPDTIFPFGRLVRSQKLYSIFILQWQTSSIPHRYRKESIKNIGTWNIM